MPYDLSWKCFFPEITLKTAWRTKTRPGMIAAVVVETEHRLPASYPFSESVRLPSMSEKTQQRRASDEQVLSADRRATIERRNTNDRRKKTIPVAFERRTGTDRRNVERRRQVDPTTCERDYSLEEVEFMSSMDLYKRLAGRQFPTWSEVLEVLHAMGYRKVAEATPLPGQPGHISRRQQGQVAPPS